VLVFLDDDVQPAPGCVAAHTLAHARLGEHVTLGPSMPAIRGRVDFFRVELRAWWLDFFGAMAEPGHRHTFRSFAAGNCALPTGLFRTLGGFDETIASCGGEDWELGVRMMQRHIPFTFIDAASAAHDDQSDLDRSLQRRRQEGRAEVIIAARHPHVLPALGLMQLEAGDPAPPSLRAMRWLAFNAPQVGGHCAGVLRRQLDLLQALRLRRQWRFLFGHLRDYWYWRGVADELGSMGRARRFVRQLGALVPTTEVFEVDLGAGIPAAEARLDEHRPAAVSIWYAGQRVGRIRAVAGAEPVCGRHLRRALATDLSGRLLQVLAVEAASGDALDGLGWLPVRPAPTPAEARWR
jgi:hypothetical protein